MEVTRKENQRTDIEWTSYLATAYAERFCEGSNATIEQQVEAWSYLIKTGICWTLQGQFGRTANELINKGLITKEGVIDWNIVDNRNYGN